MNDGRKLDVFIENTEANDPFRVYVYADPGKKSVILSVSGVSLVMEMGAFYAVQIDKRYDSKFVQREIEAAILCV